MSFSIGADRFVEPWLPELLELLQLRRGARVMQVGGGNPDQVAAVLEQIGERGTLLVLESDAGRAARLESVAHRGLHVFSYAPDGRENFGQHDALLACPLSLDDEDSVDRWGPIALGNLRPGGRFVIDLPGESPCDVVCDAWIKAGGTERTLRQFRGPSESDLAAHLREAGLRQVEALVGTHLVRAENPRALADFAVRALGADADFSESLHVALAERLKTDGQVEVIFRRTRVHGMR